MNKRSPITSHVLDVSLGKPATNLSCRCEKWNAQTSPPQWEKVGEGVTNEDGRVETLHSSELVPGLYRIEFLTGSYFENRKISTFYPSVTVGFEVVNAKEHYHVPLLLSPYGYSTYRGG